MTKRLIFTVVTPIGYRVGLSRDRWRQITRFKHPALSGHENDVRGCLRNPMCVRESAKDRNVHLFYRERWRSAKVSQRCSDKMRHRFTA